MIRAGNCKYEAHPANQSNKKGEPRWRIALMNFQDVEDPRRSG
jgi:hypothetical protein